MSKKCLFCGNTISTDSRGNEDGYDFGEIYSPCINDECHPVCTKCYYVFIDILNARTYEKYVMSLEKFNYMIKNHPIEDELVKNGVEHCLKKAEERAIDIKTGYYDFSEDAWWYETEEEHEIRIKKEEEDRIERAEACRKAKEKEKELQKAQEAEARAKQELEEKKKKRERTTNNVISIIWIIISIIASFMISRLLF